MTMHKLRNYTFRIKIPSDRYGYIITCDQFPSLSYRDTDLVSAFNGIKERVLTIIDSREMENVDG